MRALGRLLRLSLAPTAAADALAGIVLGAHGAWPADTRAFWLVPASLFVYHGSLALNDWHDREHDARTRPARPLPSGAIAPGVAFTLGIVLVLAGVACAFVAGIAAGGVMSIVALLALTYDLGGRGPWLGPSLLALCRALNLGAAIVLFHSHFEATLDDVRVFLPCLVYGLYVFTVSRLGRMEDGEDAGAIGSRPARLLRTLCAILIVAGALGFLVQPVAEAQTILWRLPALVLALLGARALWTAANTTATWTRALVERAMGSALRRMLVVTAVLALSMLSTDRLLPAIAALVILIGYPLARGLRELFPPS